MLPVGRAGVSGRSKWDRVTIGQVAGMLTSLLLWAQTFNIKNLL